MRTLFKISIVLIYFGWFIFMWVALNFQNIESEMIRFIIFFSAFLICVFAGIGFAELLRNNDLFKSISQLRKERTLYHKATQRLIKKIKEL